MPYNVDADMHRSAPATLRSSQFPKGGVPFPAPPNHRRNSRSECKGLADIAPQVPRDRTWPYPRRAPTAPGFLTTSLEMDKRRRPARSGLLQNVSQGRDRWGLAEGSTRQWPTVHLSDLGT